MNELILGGVTLLVALAGLGVSVWSYFNTIKGGKDDS